MATRNDFKLVQLKALKQFDLIQQEIADFRNDALNDVDKARLGFYFLGIECATGQKDFRVILDSIIDTSFCGTIFHEPGSNDGGVDAVLFDEDNHVINLFNFKYRESFKVQAGQHLQDAVDSTKFLMAVAQEDASGFAGRPKEKLEAIIQRENSSEIWTTRLFHISNESHPIDPTPELDLIQRQYDIDYQPVVLDDLLVYLDERPHDTTAEFIVDSDAALSFTESDLSSAKSYLVRMPACELIRITAKDTALANNYALSDLSALRDAGLDFQVLYDNVRGYLGERSSYNKSMIQTLTQEPTRFFMYNNGVTIIADDITAQPENGHKKYHFTIRDFQVVNGGQTLRTLYQWKAGLKSGEDELAMPSLLVRLFSTKGDPDLGNKIAEFTNSQNAVSPADLKSVDPVQIRIEQYLREKGILYVRKVGDTGLDMGTHGGQREYTRRIDMEKLAQILYTIKGYPERVGMQKKRLFVDYYYDIFGGANNGEPKFDLDRLPGYIDRYYAYRERMGQLGMSVYDQKVYYALYVGQRRAEAGGKDDIDADIRLVDSALAEYRKGESISEARKSLNVKFKEALDQAIAQQL
ncbi:AIPR protein [Bifidobacterium ramosum]|uniref:AIPR protein n=1 Tax=Bifidobacterium ramosum TaxID=1798158 RepID=A0A6L4X2Z8_9BIFI|nr:AIPR family protein [Bifidobacterium ramosum]KAB8288257.1 AIPR protein [Bifidobacterium ramosum]NEG71702.1 hypothetical protein [Bifidobacterium ramosum]